MCMCMRLVYFAFTIFYFRFILLVKILEVLLFNDFVVNKFRSMNLLGNKLSIAEVSKLNMVLELALLKGGQFQGFAHISQQ